MTLATQSPASRRAGPAYPLTLLGLFVVAAVVAGIGPVDRHDWMLENALTALLAAFLLISYRAFPLSNLSYTLIFVFLLLHTLGSHYTYSLVPYDRWWQMVFGRSLNSLFGFERNQYDRLVHFCFGLLMAYPIREIFVRVAGARGFWGYYLPLDVTMSFSMIYELIEWAAAVLLGGNLGQSFLGTQGDVWDAHKDMALATLGGLIAMTVTALVNWKYDRDFALEFVRSLRVQSDAPLGEVRLRALRERSAGEADLQE